MTKQPLTVEQAVAMLAVAIHHHNEAVENLAREAGAHELVREHLRSSDQFTAEIVGEFGPVIREKLMGSPSIPIPPEVPQEESEQVAAAADGTGA